MGCLEYVLHAAKISCSGPSRRTGGTGVRNLMLTSALCQLMANIDTRQGKRGHLIFPEPAAITIFQEIFIFHC